MTTRKSWNYHSAVTCCPTCDGGGEVAHHKLPTINDPFPSKPCEDCDGIAHEPECPVCGFDQVIPGYDCLACDTVAVMWPADLARFDADKFAAAVKVALGHALAAARKEAA